MVYVVFNGLSSWVTENVKLNFMEWLFRLDMYILDFIRCPAECFIKVGACAI